MKKLIFTLWMLIGAGLSLWAIDPDNNSLIHQPYEFKRFTGIVSSGGVQVVVSQAKDFSVVAIGDEKSLNYLEIRTSGHNLVVGFRPHFGLGVPKNVVVEVGMPELTRLKISGGSAIKLHFDARHTPRLNLDISGGASLEGLLLGSVVSVELSGGSLMKIEGYAESAVLEASGGARAECVEFAVDNGNFTLSGGSYACLAVQSNIVVRANGGSRLEYRGKPDIKQNLNSGAMVKPFQ